MEIKKTPKADLENKKATWMLAGFVVVLSFIFVAFEWSEVDKKVDLSDQVADVAFEQEIMPITEQPQTPPPPPPPQQVIEEIKIVDDDVEVADQEIQSSEDTNQAVEVKAFIPVAEPVAEEVKEDEIFQVVEENPEFPGGDAARLQYLNKNIKYPTISSENGVQGRVIVQFVVNKDGSIVDAVVVRGLDQYIDKEALRVVNAMPKWKPGKQRGTPVRVRFTLPIVFRLNN